jgi:hypothetical protein
MYRPNIHIILTSPLPSALIVDVLVGGIEQDGAVLREGGRQVGMDV